MITNTKGIFLTIALMMVFSYTVLLQCNRAGNNEIISIDKDLLRNGDLAFRKGRGIFSDIFSEIGGSNHQFSHVGIVYKENDALYVVHTEASEISGIGFAKIEELSGFVSAENAEKYGFYRVKGLNVTELETVLSSALRHVKEKTPFDMAFNLKDDNKLYCTELVYKVFKGAGVNLIGSPHTLKVPSYDGYRTVEIVSISQLVESSLTKLIVN